MQVLIYTTWVHIKTLRRCSGPMLALGCYQWLLSILIERMEWFGPKINDIIIFKLYFYVF